MHKTQVFVAPTGDHYRTRLTHTLEVTQSRASVARALALNEDLVEAIGLGHDLGHPPFGHIGEEALDRCLRERFGSSFLHHEHSLRVVDTLERDGARAQPDARRCATGSSATPAARQSRPRSRARSSALVDRVAYINHDIDDALRAGVITAADLPGEPIEVLGDTGPRADRRARPRSRRELRARRRHRPGRGDRRGDVGAARRSCSTGSTSVPRPPASMRRSTSSSARCSTTTAPTRRRSPSRSRPAISSARVTDYLAGMTDRFCIRVFESLSVPVAFAP